MKTVAEPNECTGVEGAEIKGIEVEDCLCRGVRRQERLEAAVESEPVDDVGPNPAAGAVAPFEDERIMTLVLQPNRRGEPREASADDDDIMIAHAPDLPRRVMKSHVIDHREFGRGGRPN